MVNGKNKGGRPTTAKNPWLSLYNSVGGQAKLAEKLGVSKSTVGKWAAGVHRIPEIVRKELIWLCDVYKIVEGVEDVFCSRHPKRTDKTDRSPSSPVVARPPRELFSN